MAHSNKQYSDPASQLVPGDYAHTGAPGSQGARTPAPDAGHISVTSPSGTWWSQDDVPAGSTNQPGQFGGTVFAGVPEDFVTDSGAGSGTYSRIRRFDWQHQVGEL